MNSVQPKILWGIKVMTHVWGKIEGEYLMVFGTRELENSREHSVYQVWSCKNNSRLELFCNTHWQHESTCNLKKMTIFMVNNSILLWGINVWTLMNNPIFCQIFPSIKLKYFFPLLVWKFCIFVWNWFWIMEWKFLKNCSALDFSFKRYAQHRGVWSLIKVVNHFFPWVFWSQEGLPNIVAYYSKWFWHFVGLRMI